MAPESHLAGSDVVTSLADETLAGLSPAARGAAVGHLTGAAIHEINNWLFAILGQVELLRMEPALDAETERRLRTIAETGEGLKQLLRRLGAVARDDRLLEPAPLEDEVASVLALPGFDGASVSATGSPLAPAGDPAAVGEIVLQTLLALSGAAPAIDIRHEDDSAVLEARPTRTGRPARDDGLGLAVAGALARTLGGSLVHDEGTLRLVLPLARAEKPRGPSAAPTM